MGEQSYGEITRVILYDAGLHISDSENYKPSQNLAQQRLKNHDIKVSRNTEHILKSAALRLRRACCQELPCIHNTCNSSPIKSFTCSLI